MSETATKPLTLRLGHSPDPDDAFMWYPLANFTAPDGVAHTPQIDTGRYAFEHVLEDIQALNERSFRGELEITAISIHTYPYVAQHYALTSCGASLGDGYGPMIVTADPAFDPAALTQPGGPTLAIPGKQTSAWLATQLWLKDTHGWDGQRPVNHDVVPFDQIIAKVAAGEYAAGLIIHEGQITYSDHDLRLMVDLGQWWGQTRGLPLPLGGNCVRRDLGQPAMGEVCGILKRSIEYALTHRDEAVRFALNWARGIDDELADRFVGMYVNDWALDYGDAGREAVRQFLKEGIDAGLVPDCGAVDFIEPG
jgi:1,4-dihydroxy-6-naphthoate synthase